jgi:acetyltransferase-like isoleucine patch superfamily enzyme
MMKIIIEFDRFEHDKVLIGGGMRTIAIFPIVLSFTLFVFAGIVTFMTSKLLYNAIPFSDFREIIVVFLFILIYYLYSVTIYRIFVHVFSMKAGPIKKGSLGEFIYHVHSLFFIFVFHSLITLSLPFPIKKMIYVCLGAKFGSNSYTAGLILDPLFTKVGNNTVIGQDTLLYSHVIEGDRLALEHISIGDNVTIGAKSIIMGGTRISSGAIVGAGSVVLKGTQIGPNQRWGGVPAHLLKN